ncbi:MAG: nitroreductase family protein [Cyclobacteriaceae bacterium]|nr:nitroreductase family protein [Cyclobacteriaceae bacterium]
MSSEKFIPYRPLQILPTASIYKSEMYHQWLDKRRSIREFSDKPVDRKIIENIIKAASTAPSGAHKQPWVFCAISDSLLKSEIKMAAEKEEYENYHSRMSKSWLEDLKPFETNWQKPFLEIAPWLIVVFSKSYDVDEYGKKLNNYYVKESVGLACGILLSAIHHAGLCALTHTPSPMDFLSKLLKRPGNERPFLLIPVGYAADQCMVPSLQRKPLELVSEWYE